MEEDFDHKFRMKSTGDIVTLHIVSVSSRTFQVRPAYRFFWEIGLVRVGFMYVGSRTLCGYILRFDIS